MQKYLEKLDADRNAMELADLGQLQTHVQRTALVRIVLALALLGTLALLR